MVQYLQILNTTAIENIFDWTIEVLTWLSQHLQSSILCIREGWVVLGHLYHHNMGWLVLHFLTGSSKNMLHYQLGLYFPRIYFLELLNLLYKFLHLFASNGLEIICDWCNVFWDQDDPIQHLHSIHDSP